MGKCKNYDKRKYEDCLNNIIREDLSDTQKSIIIETLIRIKNGQSSISQNDLQNRTLKCLLNDSYDNNIKFVEKIKKTLKNQNYNKTALSITLLDDMCKIFDKTPNELLQIDFDFFQEIVYFEYDSISNITATVFSQEKTIFKREPEEFFYEEFICRSYPFLGLSLKATYNKNKQSFSYVFFYSLSIKIEESTDNDYFEHFHPSLDDTIKSPYNINILTKKIYKEALSAFQKRALTVYYKYFSEKTFPLSDIKNTYKTDATMFFNCISTQIALAEDKQSTIDKQKYTNDSYHCKKNHNNKRNLDSQMKNAKTNKKTTSDEYL